MTVSLRTGAWTLATLGVLAIAYQAGTVVVHRTSQNMPPAKQPTGRDGRVYATVQLCWEPAATAQGAPHAVLGPLDRGETNVSIASCGRPWARKGLVSMGDRVAVAWVMNAEAPARVVRWRITLNKRERMGGNASAQHQLNACVVGIPPCELP